jgi:hypothetical protein
VGAATAFADARDRSAAISAPAVRSDGAPAHRNGGERTPAPPAPPATPATPASPAAPGPDASPAVPRVPAVDANPRPEPAGRFAVPAEASAAADAPATPPVESPATVDLRSDGLADPVRHDDDPPVPAGPVAAGEPGRP